MRFVYGCSADGTQCVNVLYAWLPYTNKMQPLKISTNKNTLHSCLELLEIDRDGIIYKRKRNQSPHKSNNFAIRI